MSVLFFSASQLGAMVSLAFAGAKSDPDIADRENVLNGLVAYSAANAIAFQAQYRQPQYGCTYDMIERWASIEPPACPDRTQRVVEDSRLLRYNLASNSTDYATLEAVDGILRLTLRISRRIADSVCCTS